ncbi:hypothetical protein BDV37DRAFT_265471 [Aspergillus pseudonomiae]|uniref:Uncharacterized protein n=1 Tax=Aspergillus pseudonomiae TaxID=1506151 RepID=A0A5N7CVD5_9EURO|nr:uncharacterized protein BDV37DRAFT_265471 [Aspergillus pseudonomiae]KAE8397553.1 hypothetical protein BDV37DRAFT_265471 [Aspergillus pseudonomiae]
MGVPDNELAWGLTVMTPGNVTTHGRGIPESLAKLRRDATWWFQNSSEDTRIVILISIKQATKEIRFEKWQLVPPNVSRPVTWQAIDQLRQQPSQMTPLCPAAGERTITGGPLVIPFRAMFDRQPTGAEGDIFISYEGFQTITRFV